MAEQRRLLVDDVGNDGQAADRAERAGGRTDLRQRLDGHAEETAQLRVPLAGVEDSSGWCARPW